MKKLIREDINLETKFSYEIYRCGTCESEIRHMVYEINPDGERKYVGEFSEDDAYKFVREKCE